MPKVSIIPNTKEADASYIFDYDDKSLKNVNLIPYMKGRY